MRQCRGCKQRLEDNQTYCGFCGRDNSDVYTKPNPYGFDMERDRFNLPSYGVTAAEHKQAADKIRKRIAGTPENRQQKSKKKTKKTFLESILDEVAKNITVNKK